ncbi:MAG: glycoside hydrolase family 2 TIM barrel-domain containing protein [Flavobacteriaceae bacterium]
MNKLLTLIKLNFLFYFILFINSCDVNSNNKFRETTNLNTDWQYLEKDLKNIDDVLADKDWQSIQLPHTWNSTDVLDTQPGYRRSGSWYKKNLKLSSKKSGSIYQLYFEGVNISSTIYLNGVKVGGHIGGYIGFTIDVTNNIKQGNNELMVYVNNGYDPEIIPSQKSDFFIYGGITRDVFLLNLPTQHIKNIKITTPEVSELNAKLVVNFDISKKIKNDLSVKATLNDDTGGEVISKIFDVTKNNSLIQFDSITNPNLWDTKSPYLYKLIIELIDNGVIIDKVVEKVGFRWFEFKDYGAFYLNGKQLKLRGTHRHEEHAGVGAAMSNEQHRYDIELIKDMGANFVRLAHYPQDPEIYRACDELGLLVWDELPWCRGGLGNNVWKKNTKKMLREIIQQNFNHPSIIIWSLGNEISWLPDFENGKNIEQTKLFLKELNSYAHELDQTRKTAIRRFYEGSDIVDVFSPSIWSGWYSGSYKSYQKAIEKSKKEYKHFLHAEYGGSSHVGRHTENPITGDGKIPPDGWEEDVFQNEVANIAKLGDWSENYIVDLFDWYLRISENDNNFVGNAQWAFKDFGTPLRPENPIPYLNQKGLVDRNNNPKDAYYVFKSYWNDTTPFTYIESHTWTERQGPKGLKRQVSVYSNCPEVELFLNGKSMGLKQRNIEAFPASGLNWDISFVEGENIIVSRGISKNGLVVKDSLKVNYRYSKNGKATSLSLKYKILESGNYLITATARDNKGLRCLDYEDRVYFQCLSGGKAYKSMGTPNGSEVIEMANGKASIEVIRNSNKSPIKVMVLGQNFKGTYLTID